MDRIKHLLFDLTHDSDVDGVEVDLDLSNTKELPVRFAGEMFGAEENAPAIASTFEDMKREREEARILHKMILEGGLGDPNQHRETLRKLEDQISGVGLRGV